MNKWTVVAIKAGAALAVAAGMFVASSKAMDYSFSRGMNAAVSVCYQMPGIWANNETGETIMCGPLDMIPRE